MSETLHRGEITNAGLILEPAVALDFGRTVMRCFSESHNGSPDVTSGGLFLDESDLELSTANMTPGANSMYVGQQDEAMLTGMYATLAALLEAHGQNPETFVFASDVFVGTPDDGSWHIDGEEGFRLLVDLAATPLILQVATDWSDADFSYETGRTLFNRNGPERHKKVPCTTGQGLLIDNMHKPRKRAPHAGMDAPGKIFLRTIAVQPVR